MNRKIVVPEGMMKAADEAWDHFGGIGVGNRIRTSLEAALRWLSDGIESMVQNNPAESDYMRSESMSESDMRAGHNRAIREVMGMFLAPDEDGPLKNLLVNPVIGSVNGEQVNDRIRTAYRLGKESK